jgi:hypothetical protein
MNAAAEIEDASHCLRDEAAKRVAISGAKHYRDAANALFAATPRREWQGLKEWEINDGRDQLPTEDLCNWSFRQGVYFAEKALKERNNG